MSNCRNLIFFLMLSACATSEHAANSDRSELKMNLNKQDKSYLTFPQYRSVTLSPSGKYTVVASRFNNQGYISILDTKTKKILGSLDTGENFNPSQFFWLGDKRILVSAVYVEGYLKGAGSKQVLFSINTKAGDYKQLYPPVRQDRSSNLTSSGFSIVSDELVDGKFLLVSEQRYGIHGAQSQLSRINVHNGRVTLYDKIKMDSGTYSLDNNNRARIAIKYQAKDESYQIFTKDLKKSQWNENNFWKKKGKGVRLIGFEKDNSTFYFLANNDRTILSLFKGKISPKGTVTHLKEVFSPKNSDISKINWDFENKTLSSIEFGHGKPIRKYISNNKYTTLAKALDKAFPGEVVYMSKKKGDYHLLRVLSDKRPMTYYLFNTSNQSVDEFLSANEKVRGTKGISPQLIQYKARDGVIIYGLFYKPRNWTPQTPLIVHPHGGPYGIRDSWGYNGDIQFFLARGYSLAQFNFRGSGGRGEKFEKLGYKKQGTTMQYDLADGVNWLVQKGYATKGKACAWGISYGGYASVMNVMMFPELYACGIGFGGVYDYHLITQSGDTTEWEGADNFFTKTLPKSKEKRLAMSPVSRVAQLKRPLYIMHGSEDVRVTIYQARRLKSALEENKKALKYVEFPNVGHWFVSEQTQKHQAFSEIIDFLDSHLK